MRSKVLELGCKPRRSDQSHCKDDQLAVGVKGKVSEFPEEINATNQDRKHRERNMEGEFHFDQQIFIALTVFN